MCYIPQYFIIFVLFPQTNFNMAYYQKEWLFISSNHLYSYSMFYTIKLYTISLIYLEI